MNDLSIRTTLPAGNLEELTLHLADLTQASARTRELLTQNLTLRQIAVDLLLGSLEAIGVADDFGVSSPEAIFFNRLDDDQHLHSIAMPDLLVDAMRHGLSSLEDAAAAFFVRHDAMDPGYALSPEQNQALKEAVARYSHVLPEAYQAHLDALWRKPVAKPDDPQSFDTTVELLVEQQRSALCSEIALCGYAARVSEQEQTRLSSVVEDSSTEGLFGLLWTSADGIQITVSSAYVVSEWVEDRQPSGVVFLVMPAFGIERFDSADALREALNGRLAGSLKHALPIRDQLHWHEGQAFESDAWTFEAMDDPLLKAHVDAVHHKQTEDCRFLLTQDSEGVDQPAFYAQLARVQTCEHLDEAMAQRFNAWVTQLGEIAEPHWRKFADPGDRAHLLRLEQAHGERKKNLDEWFGALHSLETSAHCEISQYIRQYLGRFIDPRDVRVQVQDTINLGADDALEATYENSLLEFAVQGLSSVAGQVSFSPSSDQLHAEFSAAFVAKMLDELNIHRRYEEALEQRLNDEDVLRAMTHHRDSAIALSAFTAKMQGHLLQDRSHDLVHRIRGDMPLDGAVHSIGSLYLTATDSRFRDVIVYEEQTQTDEHYVMYAPGAPGGRDFFEFGSWRQLSMQVGGWLATDHGLRYVHDQLAGRSEGGVIAALNNVQLKPSSWGPDSCSFVRSTGQNFEGNLSDLVRQKALRTFASFNGHGRPAAELPSYADAAVLAVVNARIAALNAEFARLSPGLMSLRDYVHGKTSQLLNDYLRSADYAKPVDPDTLYLGLGMPYTGTPDFGEHSDLRSLTDLMMYGSEDILSHRPHIHLYSSVGLDVSRFPVGLIQFMDKQVREADLGARYMDYLTDEFLGRGNPLYVRRKALLATRIQHEMTRGALTTFHKGYLDEAQYAWLRQTIIGLSNDAPKTPSITRSAVSTFQIADQIIEGVYIFRDFSTDDPDYNLLYTPDAPDGRDFRPLSDYAQLLDPAQMQGYYASRVAHAGKKLFGEFVEELIRGGKYDPDFIKIHNRMENRIADIDQLYGEMFGRMIADVDSQTESLAEKRLALAWTIIRWTGTILLLPFPHASFGWGLLTTSVTFVQAFDAYAAGDRATAIPLFVAGALGLLSGTDATRALIMGGHGLAKTAATSAGLWAWKRLDLGAGYRLTA